MRRRVERLPPADGPDQGATGEGGDGPELGLLALGDSIIAGVGVSRTEQALPARLAAALARDGRCRVRWRAVGESGARSRELHQRVMDLAERRPAPSVVVVSNGINDATAPGSDTRALEGLQAVIEALERRFPDAMVFQLALPPLGAFPALPAPLRGVLGQRAAFLDDALRAWLRDRPRAHYLPFERLPEPGEFARDGYHPAEAAVASWADSLATPIREVLSRRG